VRAFRHAAFLTHVLADNVDLVDIARVEAYEGWSGRRVLGRDEIWSGAAHTISDMALHALVSPGEGRGCILPDSTLQFLSVRLGDLK